MTMGRWAFALVLCLGMGTLQAAEEKKAPAKMNADEAEKAGLCPVKKSKSKESISAEVSGKTYHFCCNGCKGKFVADPTKYGVEKKM